MRQLRNRLMTNKVQWPLVGHKHLVEGVEIPAPGLTEVLVEGIVEAEDSEIVSATVAQLVQAVTAVEVESDGECRTFVTQSPDWWMTGRTFGGMVVAQALNAALQTVPRSLEVHSLHGYFLRPIPTGSDSARQVSAVRDGRSFSLRQVSSLVDGKECFRMTCSFHAPEAGDEYQMPMAPGLPGPDDIPGVEAPFPFDIREVGATKRREDGSFSRRGDAGFEPGRVFQTTQSSMRACWPTFRT